jgi:hypothetical protein
MKYKYYSIDNVRNMFCFFSCFTIKQPIFNTIIVPKQPNEWKCLVCKEIMDNECISCTLCNVIIGHTYCIKQWVTRRKSCPNCLHDI